MSRRDGQQSEEQCGSWKLLAEQAHQVLSATTIEQGMQRGLRIAGSLGNGDLAIAHWHCLITGKAQSLAVSTGREFNRFDQSRELGSPDLLDLLKKSLSETLFLQDPQLRGLQETLPPGCSSLVLALKDGEELLGALQIVSIVEGTDLLAQVEALRTCANLLARMASVQNKRQQLQAEADSFRKFISQISEGVWRIQMREPVPADWPLEKQIEGIFNEAYLTECNTAMARMYGYERAEELVGTPLSCLLIPEDPRNHLFLESFVRNGYRLNNAESVERDRHGRTHYFVNNLVGVLSPKGLQGAWSTQTDVTAYRELENRLTVAAAEAAEANQAKSAFLANVSHEIRSPLGVMLGFADLALDAPDLTEETRAYISAIRRNGQQVTEILGEVLDLSKIEASRMEIEEIRFPLVPMLSEVISFLDLHAREKGISLSLEKIGALPKVVKTDPTRLRQVLTNLIGNAIKFTEKGHVTLRVRMASPPKAGTPVQLEFTVADTGIGIPPELKEKLFQPFTQLEVSTSRRFGGTGLGLTLSKQLVQALGGDLSLQSSHVGRGSTFAFTISAGTFEGDMVMDSTSAAAPTVPQSAAQPEGHEEFAGKKVLVIEDSEDNQMLISRYLTAVGIQVEVASNGFEGIEKAESANYDLLVLDIQMPGMDGHQVARTLREKGFAQPIIALTAHAFKEDRERAFRSGFNEYLTKPINRVVLLKTLGHRLGSPALH